MQVTLQACGLAEDILRYKAIIKNYPGHGHIPLVKQALRNNYRLFKQLTGLSFSKLTKKQVNAFLYVYAQHTAQTPLSAPVTVNF